MEVNVSPNRAVALLILLSVEKLSERSRSVILSGRGVCAAEGKEDRSRPLPLSITVELLRLSRALGPSRSTPREVCPE